MVPTETYGLLGVKFPLGGTGWLGIVLGDSLDDSGWFWVAHWMANSRWFWIAHWIHGSVWFWMTHWMAQGGSG